MPGRRSSSSSRDSSPEKRKMDKDRSSRYDFIVDAKKSQLLVEHQIDIHRNKITNLSFSKYFLQKKLKNSVFILRIITYKMR